MLRSDVIGVYGKLPAHGDFISREIPNHIANAWDAWLQGYVGTSQQVLGEDWLDIYLTSPIWRFCISDGIFDENAWQGIILPSVDRVGRYFPFSIVAKSGHGRLPTEAILDSVWFEQLESIALQALAGNMQLEQLIDAVKRIGVPSNGESVRLRLDLDNAGQVFEFNDDKPNVSNAYPQLIDMSFRQFGGTYSVWSTGLGSDRISPSFVTTTHLPTYRSAVALLDGLWQNRGWSTPILRMD